MDDRRATLRPRKEKVLYNSKGQFYQTASKKPALRNKRSNSVFVGMAVKPVPRGTRSKSVAARPTIRGTWSPSVAARLQPRQPQPPDTLSEENSDTDMDMNNLTTAVAQLTNQLVRMKSELDVKNHKYEKLLKSNYDDKVKIFKLRNECDQKEAQIIALKAQIEKGIISEIFG